MNRTGHQQTGGFTLIEIMMAMGIFALALAAIYATWTAILKATKVGLDVAAQVQRERIAVSTVELALTAAESFQADLQYYSFVVENGSHADTEFYSAVAEVVPAGGAVWRFRREAGDVFRRARPGVGKAVGAAAKTDSNGLGRRRAVASPRAREKCEGVFGGVSGTQRRATGQMSGWIRINCRRL